MTKGESGFTLIEFVVAMAIVSILTYAGAMTISRVVQGTHQANDDMTALRQVQNIGYWLTRDLSTSQNISPGDDPETPQLEFVSLVWTDWENARTYNVSYYYENMANGLKRVKRQNIARDSSYTIVSSSTQYLAEGIVSPVALSQTGDIWNVLIEARSRKQTEIREYQVLPRPNA